MDNTIETNVYNCQTKMFNYLKNINIAPYQPHKIIIPLISPFQNINQRMNQHYNLHLLIKAVEYIEKQPIGNII